MHFPASTTIVLCCCRLPLPSVVRTTQLGSTEARQAETSAQCLIHQCLRSANCGNYSFTVLVTAPTVGLHTHLRVVCVRPSLLNIWSVTPETFNQHKVELAVKRGRCQPCIRFGCGAGRPTAALDGDGAAGPTFLVLRRQRTWQ